MCASRDKNLIFERAVNTASDTRTRDPPNVNSRIFSSRSHASIALYCNRVYVYMLTGIEKGVNYDVPVASRLPC